MIFILFFTSLLFSQYSEPINLENFNSNQNEFGLVFNSYESKFYFHSDRSKVSKFYYFNSINDSEAKYLNSPINSGNSNVSYIRFIDTAHGIYSKFEEYKSQAYLNLYSTNFQKQVWGKGKLISSICTDNFYSQSTISSDGSFMIFVSDVNSESKDTDLFISYRNQLNGWDTPIPLSEINSTGNEITPYLVGNDTLLFATDGQGGKGGFDIFISKKILGKWQRPHPINEINTINNESDPCAITLDTLFFSSDRPGGKGKYDLYFTSKINTRKVESKLNEIDISFSSFVSNINVKTQTKIKHKALYPYIHYDNNELNFNNSHKERNLETIKNISNFIKSGNKIKLAVWTRSEVEVENTKNSKYITDERISYIQKLFNENHNISKDKIEINYFYSNDNINYLYFYSDDAFLESFVEFDKEITIEPNDLYFQLDIHPKSVVEKYSIELVINDNTPKQVLVGKETPINSKVEFSKLLNEISGSDSLKVMINIFDVNGNSITKDYSYTISNSYEKIKDQENEVLSFFLISVNDIKSKEIYSNIIKKVKSKYTKKEFVIESSFNINSFIQVLESISDLKFKYKLNDEIGKEIRIR